MRSEAGEAGPARRWCRSGSRAVRELGDVELGRGLAALAEGRLPRRLVRAVGGRGLQDLIDLVAARDVVLLQANAVRLLAELLADHLELAGVLILGGVAGQDDV